MHSEAREAAAGDGMPLLTAPQSDPEAGATHTGSEHYKGHPTRFMLLLVFALSNCMNACLWICFAPIINMAEARFETSDPNAINMFSTIFMIMYVPGSIVSVYLLERYGLRVCLLAGAALNLACAWIRYVGTFAHSGYSQYAVVMFGQVIGALSQPIFTNAPSRIAGDWFPVKERDLATVAAAMSNPLGNAVGSLLPSLIVNGPGDIPALMLYLAIATAVIMVLAVLFVRDRPPFPPSAGAEVKLRARAAAAAAEGTQHPAMFALHHLKEDFIALLQNRNFLLLLTAFSLGLGTFNALLTVLAQWIAPCGYDSNIAGYGGAALLGAGLLGAVGAGILLERTRAYVPILKMGILTTLSALIFLLAVQRKGMTAVVIVALGAMGAGLIPLLPIALENAAECSFPVPEDNSAALLLIGGQLIGIGFTSLMTALIGMPPTSDCSSIVTPVAGLLLGSLGIAATVLMFFRKDYRRQAAEKEREAESQLE